MVHQSNSKPPRGRAATDSQKRAVIERIYQAWVAMPWLRLGQLLTTAQDPGIDLFYAEDEDVAEKVEKLWGTSAAGREG